MDFSDLMNIAADKQQVTEQKIKSKKQKGGDSSQVSSDAVKAFLAKQNAEKVRQKEQEEASKRARIQARLQREQKDKSKNKKKADTLNDTPTDAGNQNHGFPYEKRRQHPTRAEPGQPSKNQLKPKSAEIKRTSKQSKEAKYVERKGREGRHKGVEVKNSDRRVHDEDKKKAPSKQKKPTADALSFQELMNVAQKQVNNPDALRKLTGKPRPKQEETESEKVEHKMGTKDRTKDEKLKNKTAVGCPSSSQKISKGGTEKRGVQKHKLPTNIRKKQETSVADVSKRNVPLKAEVKKTKQMTIERTTISEKVNRHPEMKRGDMRTSGVGQYQRKRRYDDYDDDDDEYDDEMDEFIDDSEDTPDISSYIKDIFGYDRNKFRDRDDDTNNMESSFADIQREEAKSSRIAKLEDEIEKLKETYEAQRQNKKLKR